MPNEWPVGKAEVDALVRYAPHPKTRTDARKASDPLKWNK